MNHSDNQADREGVHAVVAPSLTRPAARDFSGQWPFDAHRTARVALRAFTLIELLIIVSILGILAAVVFPVMTTSTDQARVEALATNTTHVREMILYQEGLGNVALSPGGSPLVVDPAWFRGGKLPMHAWTSEPMNIQTVSLAANVVFPAVKVFNPLVAGAKSAWYNSTNGAFCVLVPPKATDAETLAQFNGANKTGATAINQTTN